MPVAAILQERLARVATEHGTATAWDWIEQQAGQQLPDEARAMMEGHLLAWLTYQRPLSEPAYDRLAAGALHLVKALDDDFMFAGYLPMLLQLAQDLQAQHQRQPGNVARDKALIRDLADYFAKAGGKVTSTPTGAFCRFLDAVWEILPPDQRCARDAFVQYVKTAWVGEHSSPLRKRRGKRTPPQ
jgi:hypothetical protein